MFHYMVHADQEDIKIKIEGSEVVTQLPVDKLVNEVLNQIEDIEKIIKKEKEEAAEAAAAAERVTAAKNDALTELRGVATELAQAAAERLIDSSVDTADVQAAVDTAIQQNASGS